MLKKTSKNKTILKIEKNTFKCLKQAKDKSGLTWDLFINKLLYDNSRKAQRNKKYSGKRLKE